MKRSQAELETLIQEETDLIQTMEKEGFQGEHETYSNGSPKGEYAVWCTKLKDAYWRRRNWRLQLKDLEKDQNEAENLS